MPRVEGRPNGESVHCERLVVKSEGEADDDAPRRLGEYADGTRPDAA